MVALEGGRNASDRLDRSVGRELHDLDRGEAAREGGVAFDVLLEVFGRGRADAGELTLGQGTAELAGALGLLLPALTRIKPSLTPLAAAGLVTIMALASVFHATRGESGGIVVNLVLGSVAAFIAWGRYKKAPIAAR